MKQDLEQAVKAAVKSIFGVDVSVELTRPDEQFGDYATNVALQLAKQLGKNPREVAETIAKNLPGGGILLKSEVAGPGFLNLTLSDAALARMLIAKLAQPLEGQTIVTEYSDPNPFKVLHAGHLYTSVVGDAISNLLQGAGAKVHRVNFGGDVGLHVGKTMWAILHEAPDYEMSEDDAWCRVEEMAKDPLQTRARWMAERYVAGNNAYEQDEAARVEIVELNRRVYQVHNENDQESSFARIYWICRQWSYDYFDDFYADIDVDFEKYYPESETAPIGLATVREQLAEGVYEESDGAVVFAAEKYGLHTRVFINSQGLPTYEAKDVGLIMAKWRDYHFDRSIIITSNDIIEYMKVVLKSIEQFMPNLAQATTHLTHGIVKLNGGVKMSSRKGNILLAEDILAVANAEAVQLGGIYNNRHIALAAVKYAFLKQRMGADIIYDPEESVSLDGNSGPYLQYAHARARSILWKAEGMHMVVDGLSFHQASFEAGERSLLRKITEYPEVVARATDELMPHHICTYLYELAQKFNSFYEHNRVIGDDRQAVRLQLVAHYADTLKNGLGLLGIAAPDKM